MSATAAKAATAAAGPTARFTPARSDLVDLATKLSGSSSLGLAAGARVLVSPQLVHALSEVDLVLADRGIVLIEGPPGSGKTLLEHLMMARATQLGATAVRVQTGRRPSGKQLSAAILRALEPDLPTPKTQNQTEDVLKQVLAAPRQALVVYDEAQHLGVRGIEDTRYFWDETPDRFPLVLSGVHLSRILAGHPQLADRIGFRYRLTALDHHDSVTFAAALHPVLTETADRDPALLAEVDHCWVRGNPRRWTNFLKIAGHYLRRAGTHTLTDATAYHALTRVADPDSLDTWSRTRP